MIVPGRTGGQQLDYTTRIEPALPSCKAVGSDGF